MRSILISNYSVQLYTGNSSIGDLEFARVSLHLDKELNNYKK